MPIQDLIEVASGTVTGRDHTFGGNLVLGKPNQDAFATAWTNDDFIAVLCDGCSSGEHSEVGAQLFCRLLLSEIVWLMEESDTTPLQSPGIWSFGDCAVFHDGKMSHAKFPGNAPPYPGYLLLPKSKIKLSADDLNFCAILAYGKDNTLLEDSLNATLWHIQELLRLLESPAFNERQCVESFFLCTATVVIVNEANLDMLPIVVGTDGFADVPDPSIFLEDRMFSNPANVTRTLRKMNQPTVRIDPGDPFVHTPERPPRLIKTDGILPDDTTLVAIRRKPCE